MMIELMLAAAMLQAPDPCYAVPRPRELPGDCTSWRHMIQTPRGESFIDPASLVRADGGIFEIRSRVIYREPVGETRSTVVRFRYDCARRTGAALHLTLYDTRGVILSAEPLAGALAAPVTAQAGSAHERTLAEYCQQRTES